MEEDDGAIFKELTLWSNPFTPGEDAPVALHSLPWPCPRRKVRTFQTMQLAMVQAQ